MHVVMLVRQQLFIGLHSCSAPSHVMSCKSETVISSLLVQAKRSLALQMLKRMMSSCQMLCPTLLRPVSRKEALNIPRQPRTGASIALWTRISSQGRTLPARQLLLRLSSVPLSPEGRLGVLCQLAGCLLHQGLKQGVRHVASMNHERELRANLVSQPCVAAHYYFQNMGTCLYSRYSGR